MNNLTTIASIPQGGGCASKLPAEVATLPVRKSIFEGVVVKVIKWPDLCDETTLLRSAYFQEQLDEETPLVWPAIDLGVFGGE